ncbi:MAG TPA: hypothetical protein VFQ67_16735 [Allosphingosinicella sp.]|nr:hypothetical protein [Allosphingosinicella sp.]
MAIDYNRDFAKSRNEMLLLNVLRAAAREPLQFSTMGTVTGAVGNGGELTLPFNNLIGAGAGVVSPSLKITDAVNPSVTITPLASKEFATGILSPIRPETIQLFLHNGWDAEFLLPLVVGAVVCPSGRVLLNSGEYLTPDGKRPTDLHLAFKEFFRDFAPKFAVSGKPQDRTLVLLDKEVLDALKNGLGPNLVVKAVAPQGDGSGKSVVTITDTSIPAVSGESKPFELLCARGLAARSALNADRKEQGLPVLPDIQLDEEQVEAITGSEKVRLASDLPLTKGKTEPYLVFRSVGSVIQYLGESHRVRYRQGASGQLLTYYNREHDHQILFKIDWGLEDDPDVVSTTFQGTTFRIPRLDLRRGEEEGRMKDRTLKALSFLDQLIALQTSESVIRGTQPILTIAQ